MSLFTKNYIDTYNAMQDIMHKNTILTSEFLPIRSVLMTEDERILTKVRNWLKYYCKLLELALDITIYTHLSASYVDMINGYIYIGKKAWFVWNH